MAIRPMQSCVVLSSLRSFAVLLSMASLGLCNALSQTSIDSAAGDPVVSLAGQASGWLHNNRIGAFWTVLPGGHLGPVEIREIHSESDMDRSLLLDGPFSIELKDIGVLRASDLPISGPARVEQLTPNSSASRASDRLPGVTVHYPLADPEGRFQADWAITLRQGSSYIRQILTVTADSKPLPLGGVVMIDVHSPGIAVVGTVKGSPLTTGNFFLGFESPLSESSAVADRGVSELHSGVPIGAGKSVQFSSVVGVAPARQMRRAFLTYLERERAHPYRTFLHYNSWFDIGFFNPYTQREALNRIHAFGDELNRKRGVTLDSLLFDEGWEFL